MAIDEDTLLPLHPLTKEGEQHYREYLSYRADMIILRNIHPLMYLIMTVSEWFGFQEIHDKVYEKFFNVDV